MTTEQEQLIDYLLSHGRPAAIGKQEWEALRAMRDEWRACRAIRAVHEQWEKFTRSVEPVQVVKPPDPIQSRLDAMERDLTDMWQRIHTICNNGSTPLSDHNRLAAHVADLMLELRSLAERVAALEQDKVRRFAGDVPK